MPVFADVILPLPVPGLFTYKVADGDAAGLKPGVRVTVQFGNRKVYTALVRRIHDTIPNYPVKPLLSVLDADPIVNEKQFQLWEWMSDYYLCTLGEVYKAALPGSLKLESETRVVALEGEADPALLEEKEKPVWQAILRHAGIRLSDLRKGTGSDITPVIRSLIDKGLIALEERVHTPKSRKKPATDAHDTNVGAQAELNSAQQKALAEIHGTFENTQVTLLHGVTSSGKTEIYIRLIAETLQQGRQVLYMLPEIALTTQIIARLRVVFGNVVATYHSRFTDRERVETWNNLMKPNNPDRVRIILGARSALFLPFDDLGLVIIDEEHENTFKQFDPAPRYHARDSAIVLAGIHGARVLLGTATPSVETYYNCKTGKYSLVELTERYGDMELPEITVVNTRELRKRKQMQSHFSPLLINEIGDALKNHEQVILFQNRRGFSLFLECEQCGYVPRCKHCDVSLTYHKLGNRLTCHYCGFGIPVPAQCPDCHSPALKMQGFGTEKVEEEIAMFFPEARVARMDLDTMRNRKAYEQLITRFELGESDILVGTQMVSKGLDFERVRLVGIINADTMLNYPDFRAHERSFQLMAQVSGRAGRKNKRGRVIIQTADHTHPVITQVVHHDYLSLFRTQLEERQRFRYPPYCRHVEITLKHRDREVLDKAADFLAKSLKGSPGEQILGPEYPLIGRIQNYYLKSLLIKAGKASLPALKKRIAFRLDELTTHPMFRSVIPVVDVDPY
jgi:primosomal protein N' (replication factor Y)